MLEIFDSFTGEKLPFTPIVKGQVGMYVCGITTYDYCHLGHARMLTAFDMVSRYLRSLGYRVTYVRNITDIEDKIIVRAQEKNESFQSLTNRFIEEMHADCDTLRILPPEHEPRATEHIPGMIDIIQELIAKNLAYVGANGDVYFSVEAYSPYGELSGNRPEALRAGTRVEVDEAKRDPLDFVLWKGMKSGEPSWPSPWGPGRPGWHIECSVMSMHFLGPHFDIHGGGRDLIFPHHECEIAQSRGATEAAFANIWMHNGLVRMDEEKMSKSLGNFLTIRDVLSRYPGEMVRYYFLTGHYRGPLNYSDEGMGQARQALTRLYMALRDLPAELDATVDAAWLQRFREAMNDDFNTPKALSVLHDCATEINKLHSKSPQRAAKLGATLRHIGNILGLLCDDPVSFLQTRDKGALSTQDIDKLIKERQAARANREFSEADRIRDHLLAKGVILEDTGEVTRWRRSD